MSIIESKYLHNIFFAIGIWFIIAEIENETINTITPIHITAIIGLEQKVNVFKPMQLFSVC